MVRKPKPKYVLADLPALAAQRDLPSTPEIGRHGPGELNIIGIVREIGPHITTCQGISPAEALYGRDRFSYLLKEKILATQRAGITTIIIPRRNAKDLEDVPAEARDKLKFVLLDTVDDALRCAVGIEP